ncbi:MAG: glycosyltransferase [Actinobacteria bacterium]|nr:glycosyltransferase [Actinomycetota bacterium]
MRSLKLAKYLPRLGWDVTVLTVADPPSPRRDPVLERQIPTQVAVIRAWSLEPERVAQWLRRRHERYVRSRFGSRRDSPRGPMTSLSPGARSLRVGQIGDSVRRLYRAFRGLWLPDDQRLWVPSAVKVAIRDAESRPPTVVVSSGPPHTAHLVGNEIARRLGVPHVVDLRDPWVGNPQRRSRFPLHARFVIRLEAKVLPGAAAVVTTAGSVAREVASRYPGLRRVVTIHNGFDPDDIETPLHALSPCDQAEPQAEVADSGGEQPSACPVGTDAVLRIVYAGLFYGLRDPRHFMTGLALAKKREPRLAQRLEVVFVGSGPEMEELAQSHGVADLVRATGFLSHQETQAQVAAAGATLVLQPGGDWGRCIPGKVFEYLGWRKHVLLLAGVGDLSELLSDIGGVTTVDPEDSERIAEGLLEMVEAWRAGRLSRPARDQIHQFSRVAVAERFARLLDEVVSDHRWANGPPAHARPTHPR